MRRFGCLIGPFEENTELFASSYIDEQQKINRNILDFEPYISKLGISYVGDYNLDLEGQREGRPNPDPSAVNDITEKRQWVQIIEKDSNQIKQFQIGKTRMLELEDVKIISLQFKQPMNSSTYIHYIIEM